MRTQIRALAALLALGSVFPAWGIQRAEPATPPVAIESPSANEPGQEPVKPPLPSRGQLLYENHCMVCHASIVHIRTRQQATSLSALRAQVVRWAASMQLHWSTEDIDDVVGHLDRQYYRFDSR